MTAVSGTSEIYGWSGLVASRTALRVNPGATLTIKESGNPTSPLPANQLYFDYFELAGANTADIDASTLEIDLSGVIFETGITPQIAGGTVTEGFVVRNGGLLALKGSAGTFNSTKLELRGSMQVDSSTLTLGLRNLLTVSSSLYLANAEVSLAEDASIIVSDETLVSGTNTISTTRANPPFGPGFRSAIALQDSSTVLNITGTGRVFSSFVAMSGGTLNLDMGPGGDPFFIFQSDDLPLFFSGGGQVNISPQNFLEIRNGILDMNLGGVMAIHNQGTILVEGGVFRGPGTVTGTGSVYVGEGGEIQVLDTSSPLVLQQQQLEMDFDSTITLGLRPSAGTASRIEAAGVYLETAALPIAPVLNLQLSGDTALFPGTKFVLADYDQLAGNVHAPQFRGLPDGHVFQLGLNTYQILYTDAEYGTSHGGNSSVITLTVVSVRGAIDDSYTMIENGILQVVAPGVLANDPFYINTGGGISRVVSPPAHGNLTMGANGSFEYVPAIGFVGTDLFTYTLTSGAYTSEPAVVRISVTAQTSVLALLDTLIANVDGICNAGVLNRGECKSLHVKLAHARRDILRNRHQVAANHLTAFMHEVEAMVSSRQLTPEMASPLLLLARGIIGQLWNTGVR